ncbi:MAG: polyphosphate kinase 2, partial [Planctomycetota bacterium]
MAEKPASPTAASVDRPAERSRRARAAKKAHTAALPRPAARGDVSPVKGRSLEAYVAHEATEAAQDKSIEAVKTLLDPAAPGTAGDRAQALRAILEGAAPDDATVLRRMLLGEDAAAGKRKARAVLVNPDDELAPDWRDGGYPSKNLMRRATYEKEKFRLQDELLKLQA